MQNNDNEMSASDREALDKIGPLPAPTSGAQFQEKAVYHLVQIPMPSLVDGVRQMEAPLGFRLHSTQLVPAPKSLKKDVPPMYVLCIFEAILMAQGVVEGANLPPIGLGQPLTAN